MSANSHTQINGLPSNALSFHVKQTSSRAFGHLLYGSVAEGSDRPRYVYMFVCACVYECVCACVYARACACVCASTGECTRVHIYVFIEIYS